MAATVLGLTLTFGATTVANLVVQSQSFTETVSIAEAADEDGDFVSAALYGRKITGQIEAIDNGYTTVIGTAITITGSPTGTFYVTQKAQTRPNTGFLRRTISVTSWGGI